MRFMTRILVNGLVLISMSVLFPDKILLSGIGTTILVSIVLALLEMILAPILKILTFPISILTLGLFGFVIDAGMLELTSMFSTALSFSSFWMALLTAIILRIVNGVVIRNQYY